MTDPSHLRPSRAGGVELRLQRVKIPCPQFNRFLYIAVGGNWHWVDRLGWTYQRWMDYLDRPELQTWVGYVEGAPIGYFELDRQPEENVEIAYFGLLPQFIGQGLGGRLLTAAIERAWQMGAGRVWVHTCTLDGPTALFNYQARGLRLYREEIEEMELTEKTPDIWPAVVP